jgi:hypothetical protein
MEEDATGQDTQGDATNLPAGSPAWHKVRATTARPPPIRAQQLPGAPSLHRFPGPTTCPSCASSSPVLRSGEKTPATAPATSPGAAMPGSARTPSSPPTPTN